MALRTELRVLVVDDTAVSREILRQMLERFGIGRIDTADCADAALEVLGAGRTDLVICDLNMPERDGVDVLTALRDCDRMRRTGFILTSGLDASPRFGAARRLGLDALLVKPFDAEALLCAVERVAGRL